MRGRAASVVAASALLVVTSMAAASAVAPEPVVRYDFGDGSGSVVADSGSGAALDLAIEDPGAATWVAEGLRLDRPTTIGSAGPAGKVIDAVVASGAVTVETWVAAADTVQDGPARIVSLSASSTRRNLTLGQGQWASMPSDTYDVRLRTTATDDNGRPDLATPAGTASADLAHVVYTRATDGTEAVWVDGTEVATDTRTGDLSNWDPGMRLLVGNEADGNRPWLGTLCHVAIYDTALAADDITAHHAAGCPTSDDPPPTNTPPTVTRVADQDTTVGDPVNLAVIVTDSDGDDTTLAATGLPDGLALDRATNTITGTPTAAAADTSPHTVTLTATDQPGATTTATFTWTVTPQPDDPPPPPPDPDDTWRFPDHALRVPVTVGSGDSDLVDRVALVALDLAPALDGAVLEVDATRVVEVAADGGVVDPTPSFQVEPDTTDPTTPTIALLLDGTTPASTARTFDVYLDVIGGVDHDPVDVATLVGPVTPTTDEGVDALRVATPRGDWTYDRAGGGFSSLDDEDGNDWVSWSPGGGSAGEYRGIPNLVYPDGHFHPGATSSTTTVLADGPIHAALASSTADGWSIRWDLFPTHATATVLAAPTRYWFLYEGTPGGALDGGDTVTRSDGTTAPAATSFSRDLPDPEWVAFTDPAVGRSLFLAAHDVDPATDSYRPMNGEMTVFGFGREGLSSGLTGAGRSWSVGLVDGTEAAAAVESAQDPLATTVGAVETGTGGGDGGADPTRVGDGLLVEYRFDEVAGDVVADTSGADPALDLTIADPARVTRTDGTLRLDQPTIVASDGPASGLVSAVRSSNEFTSEAWVATSDLDQNGPARILTISDGSRTRDLTMGQGVFGAESDRLVTRVRTTATKDNGLPTTSAPGTLGLEQVHVVTTTDTSGATTLYLDGEVAGTRILPGTLDGWQDMRLGLGNEFGVARPWLGTYDLVALYDRALSAQEVARNFAAGPDGEDDASGPGDGNPEAQPPTATLTTDVQSGPAPLVVALDASSSSDPDGEVVAWDWDFGDGTGGSGATVAHTYGPGTWTATVTVTDNDGLSDTASATVRVTPGDTQRVTDGLLAEYHFDEVDGDVVADVSGAQPALDLRIAQPDRVTRSPGALRLDAPTIVASDGPATAITSAVRASGEVTAEAWIATSDLDQNGPARILTLSDGSLDRDLTIGQGIYAKASDQLSVRIRTSTTGTNGATLATGAGGLDTSLTHVVVTHAADGRATMWLDGQQVATDQLTGDLAGWKDMRFGLGNEFGAARPWLGTYLLVSLYDRALDADEVEQNFVAGPGGDGTAPNLPPSVVVTTTGEIGTAPRAVTFDASASSDPDGSIVSWRWDFGDDTTGAGAVVQHTYDAVGTYDAAVVVTDDRGLSVRRRVVVTVLAPGGGGGDVSWTHLSTAAGDLAVPSPGLEQQVAAVPGDLDGDGDNDFVIAARKGDAGPSLVWYERRTGGWDRHVVEPELLSLEAGGVLHDIDGDGDLDLVVGTGNTGKQMWWWENPGSTATWTRRLIKDGGANQHHDQAFGDVDGDGTDELVYWNNGGSGTLYLAEVPADPTVEPWPATAIFTPSEQSEGLVIDDLDGDGTDDIVGGGYWFEYAGGRDFVPHEIDGSQAFTRTAVADLVEGGRPEVVFDSGDQVGELRMYEWDGNDWVGRSLLPGPSDHGHSLQVGDVDRDGHVDVMSGEMTLGGNDDAALRVLYGDGAGGFRVEEVASGYDNHESKLVDLDADGDLDILGKPFNDGTPGLDLWINELSPVGLDQWDRTVVDGAVPWRTIFVEHADLDGDGFDDLVTGGWWWHNPGTVDGDWQRRTIGAPLNQVATVADVDRDGDLDVVGTEAQGSESNSTLHWARNDGTGSFTIHDNIATAEGAFLQGVTVAEFRPGVLEVALSWQQGKGGLQVLTIPDPDEVTTSTWTWRRAHPDVSGEGLDHADIDDDGDVDLVDGGSWFRNDGTGTFTRILLHDPAEGEPDRNVLADMDGDGDLDLAMGYGHDVEGKVAWYEQGGDPTAPWTEHLVASVAPAFAQSLDVADLDGDGDLDLVVGEHTNPAQPGMRALVYENVGADTWVPHTIHVGDEHHDGMQLVDLDRDGDLDVVSIGWTHRRLLVYENRN